jgi:hypothetical protein
MAGRGHNDFIFHYDHVEIVMKRRDGAISGTAIIDLVDVPDVCQHSWYFNGRYVRGIVGGKLTLLHRHIMKPDGGQVVDHANRNALDNRRQNLRLCTHQQNSQNRRLSNDTKSGAHNIILDECGIRSKYYVVMRCNGKNIYSKRYRRIEDAIAARDRMEAVHFGEFAPIV